MNISVDNKRTLHSIAQLVEGEAFIYQNAHGGESIWIYAYMDASLEDITLLEVTHNGLISRTFPAELVLDWAVEPLEITSISFAPSTIRNHG